MCRIAIAAIVAAGAEYLILDEPTKGLDEKRKKSLSDLLFKLRSERNAGMSIISHDEVFTGGFEGREIRLSKGGIVYG